ncbi:RAD protein (Pv-fam-e) [Plasmodium vivax India VII]|uniref:RAD protein (Pv-fam-e) n=4 Tax=Plasmodium vivax TaxID=5855 RepID=A5K944_PLAVS|nr:RAD protein (Pv-fam-e) [Plasmodium vivax]EDL44340.1 RAD protein (Pv-fam-e) [Plasmodium vivax]KMZ77631.1 RAD protein (Pv-fam-e) [Plasmodium vivax India VII]KMZ84791.1 RAD protein (Pv-fam-e) [Plasmodium vivax Brazil I]KMZ96626.1 RAD protein (Pv-fam-e) [Plasmodium vivax North Korean]|eukprot:XP_001614067.1 RAD protein (Pv-fam-e) [Plasmodium vivax Sal-1]
MLSSPRVAFSFFTMMNFVLLNSGINQNGKSLSSQLDIRASPRQLSQFTGRASAYADPSELSLDFDDNEFSCELGKEDMDDGTSGQVENIESDKKDQVRGIEEMGKLDEFVNLTELGKLEEDGKEEEWEEEEQYDEEDDDEDDDDDLEDDEGGIDIESILKKHVHVVPKDKVEPLLIECSRIQTSDFQRVMDNLSSELNKLSSKYGMSEEEKKKLWNECQEEISKDLKEVDDYYDKFYDINMQADSVATASFVSSITNFLNMWTNSIDKTEKKWCAFFKEKAQEYKGTAQENVSDAQVNGSDTKESKE